MKGQFAAVNLPIKCTHGQRFVGSFVGSEVMRDWWLKYKISVWVEGVRALTMVDRKHPQSVIRAVLTALVLAEWQYVCCEPIEVVIWEEFIPALFGGLDGDIDDDFCHLLANGGKVKQGGMALHNPCDLSLICFIKPPRLKQQVFWLLLSMVVINSTAMLIRSRH